MIEPPWEVIKRMREENAVLLVSNRDLLERIIKGKEEG